MNIFLFLTVIGVSFIAVKVGSVAFEITGLDSKQSRFQALSAFTGTGFTTRESELIVTHEQRRKIASMLMILGNAGLVTLVATLVNSISENAPSPALLLPYMKGRIPVSLIPYINFAFILFAVMIAYKVIVYTKISDFIMNRAKKRMLAKKIITPVSFEEFLLTSGGYGISQIEMSENNPLLGKKLSESNLKQKDVLVLSIERGIEHITNPPADIKIDMGDRLICFGKMDSMREAACAPEEVQN